MRTCLALVCVFLLSLGACAPKPKPKPAMEPEVVAEPDFEHVVQFPGETLGLISLWYTGKSSNWTLLLEANPGLRPERINLGQIIFVPRELLVETKPMTESFVRSRAPKAEPTEEEEETIDAANTEQMAGGEERVSEDTLLIQEAERLLDEEESPAEAEVIADVEGEDVVEKAEEAPSSEDTEEVTSEEAQPEEASEEEDKAPPAAASDDVERERLLNELLQ